MKWLPLVSRAPVGALKQNKTPKSRFSRKQKSHGKKQVRFCFLLMKLPSSVKWCIIKWRTLLLQVMPFPSTLSSLLKIVYMYCIYFFFSLVEKEKKENKKLFKYIRHKHLVPIMEVICLLLSHIQSNTYRVKPKT